MAKRRNTSARLKALDRLLRDKRPRSGLELASINRQIRDLEEGHKRGLTWDEEDARRAVNFFSLLRHWKGKWAGTPFKLEPWQEHAIITPLFGWKLPDGSRRFRTAYIEVPRKNGKTFTASGIALQGLVADRENGADVYAAATMRDQACILFNDAKRSLGPKLRQMLNVFQWSITFDPLSAALKPLSADHDTLDGLNIHRAVIDELHAHKDRGLWDVLMGGTAARTQPMIVAITTAGDDETTICGEVRNLAKSALEGNAESDDQFFAFIACAEMEDDWKDPATWRKANPNLNVSFYEEFLENLCRQARASKAAENNFRRKHLNQWITGASEWITPVSWAKCKDDAPPNLDGRECYIGVDIGTRDDFAALGRMFPERIEIAAQATVEPEEKSEVDAQAQPKKARYRIRQAYVDVSLWVPENGRRDIRQPPLVNWIDQGLINVAGGNSTDFDAIMEQIHADAARYDVKQIAIDPNNTRQFGTDLVELGFDVFDFRQNTMNYHEPVTEFGVLVSEGKLHHSGHDVLRWMIGNVRLRSRNGYVMPWKEKSAEKIDGAVALLMAMGAAMFSDLSPNTTVYERENRGFITIG